MHRIPAIAVAAALGGALVAASPAHAGATSGFPKGAGFHLSGEGNVIPLVGDAQQVRTDDGTEHIFANGDPTGPVDSFLYETRVPGATDWTKTAIPTPDRSPQHEAPGVSLEVSADGTNIHAFITTCSGTYVLEAPIASTTLGAAQLVPGSATTLCEIQGQPLISEVPTTGDDDLYLYADGSTASGPPGGPLTAGDKVPGVGQRRLVTVTRDAATGEFAVLAESLGRGDDRPVVVWTRLASGAWSKRTVVARTNMPGHDIYTATMCSYGGQILVGIDIWVHGGGLHRNGIELVSRGPKGKWSTASKLPHTSGDDTDVTLTANPSTGDTLATYLQHTPGVEVGKGDGLLMTQRIRGEWHKPTHVRRLKHLDYEMTVTSVSFDSSGAPTIGYIFDD